MTSLSCSSRVWFPQSLCAVTEQIDVESVGLIRNTRFLSDSTKLKILGGLRGLGVGRALAALVGAPAPAQKVGETILPRVLYCSVRSSAGKRRQDGERTLPLLSARPATRDPHPRPPTPRPGAARPTGAHAAHDAPIGAAASRLSFFDAASGGRTSRGRGRRGRCGRGL